MLKTLSKKTLWFPANGSLVDILMTIGDVTDIFATSYLRVMVVIVGVRSSGNSRSFSEGLGRSSTMQEKHIITLC